MKKQICILRLLGLFTWSAYAEDVKTDDWGPLTNNLQMNLRLGRGMTEVKANANFTLLLKVKNTSTNQTFTSLYLNSANTDPFAGVECMVISPNGWDVSPRVKPLAGGSGGGFGGGPNQTNEFEFNLGSICKLSTTGTYKITAKKRFYQDKTNQPVVMSNTLFVKVVP